MHEQLRYFLSPHNCYIWFPTHPTPTLCASTGDRRALQQNTTWQALLRSLDERQCSRRVSVPFTS